MKYIVTCGCGATDDFAKHAAHLIHPDEPLPTLFSGESNTIAFADQVADDYLARGLRALAQAKQKYAYYVDLPSLDASPVEMVDLLTGARVL